MMTETVVNVQEVPANNNAAKQPTSSGAERPLAWVKINVEYFKTLPGIIKLVEFILGILCMALASPAKLSSTEFFLFVAVTGFILTIIWIFVYLLGIREGLKINLNWLVTELINTALWTLLYCIAFIVEFCEWSKYPFSVNLGITTISTTKGAHIAAAVFGIFNTIAYGFGSFLLWKDYKGGPN